MTDVTKQKIDVYKIRHHNSCIWGDITVEFGKTSAQVMINSDYGNYAYNWFSTGENPKQFLCDIDMHYAMNKLSDYKLYEADISQYEREIKESILDSRKNEYLTKKEAREAWYDMLTILDEFRGGDILFHSLVEHELFEKVFGDFEQLPSAQRVMPKHEHFWHKVWIPFTDELRREIDAENV